MNDEELWQAVLAQIQLNISPANFATWFKGTKLISKKDGGVLVSVPNSFTKEWFEQKYNKTILKVLHNLDDGVKEVKYEVEKSGLKVTKRASFSFPESGQLEFQEFKVDKETNLNPKYSFENFIVGSFNELAHAAATAVTKNLGQVYNPLFIYGGVGLGKTHLLEATGNEIIKNFSEKKVKYIPSEKFVSEIISGIKNQQIENLKSAYRKIDVLIIDDIQFWPVKKKRRKNFFIFLILCMKKISR